MNKFSKAQIRQIILRAKEDGQSMAQEFSHLMRIEMPEIARPNLLNIATISALLSRKVGWGPRFFNRYHEPGNIHWGELCDLCWVRNSTNTVVSFSCQGPKTCTSG